LDDPIFQTPIEYLKGVGPQKGEALLRELGIYNYADLLNHYPFKYIDRTRLYKIKDIAADLPYVQILGRLISKEVIGEKKSKRLVARIKDETGLLDLVWFQGIHWIDKILQPGKVYVVFGKPSFFNDNVQIAHAEIEFYENGAAFKKGNQQLQPVYNSTEKLKRFNLDSKGIQRLVSDLLDQCLKSINENLPITVLSDNKLTDRATAYLNIHNPESIEKLKASEQRIKFEELFFIQFKLIKNKVIRTLKFKGHLFETVGDHFNIFYNHKLPFNLTNAQKRVLKEIRTDTLKGTQMNRLLQGDVGSGKTAVALMCMLLALDNGFQACMMAPTEILATQHYHSVKNLIGEGFIEIALLTGSTPRKSRRIIHEELENGKLKILIGTHALIEDKVKFHNLGFVVIDEQHRFGVEQRSKLWNKNQIPPHVLVMTATPIPRTLAMTLYGDLDVCVIV
jgi:ATP-dependent DNA helicase RecG